MRMTRIACSALGERIYFGEVTKDGLTFKGSKKDVTSDCFKAVIEFVGEGHAQIVAVEGKPRYKITVEPIG